MVKEFTLKHADENLAQSTFIQLTQLRPQPFPALEIFRCLSVTPSLSHLSLFISPTIKTVELGGCDSDNIHVVDPFLFSLTSNPWFSSPKLNHLALRGKATTASKIPFALFSHLQSLDIAGEVDLVSLKEIGAIPQLENLVITISHSITRLEGVIGFPRLKSLHVTASFPLMQSMLALVATIYMERVTLVAVCTPAFQRVCDTSIIVKKKMVAKGKKGKKSVTSKKPLQCSSGEETLSSGTWAPCLAKLNSRWSTSLISITLCLDKSKNFKEPIPSGLFADLPPFSKVERMVLIDCGFQSSDEDIRELALALPELRELRLSVVDCVSVNVVQAYSCSDRVFESSSDEDSHSPLVKPPQKTSSPRTTTIEALGTR
jgi:hypothetical protein